MRDTVARFDTILDFDRWTLDDIATRAVHRVPAGAPAADVARDLQVLDFDVALVEGSDRVIETTAAARAGTSQAGDVARALDDLDVVQGCAPILWAGPALRDRPTRFVLRDGEVVGIVTVADLERPAARLAMLAPLLSFEDALARLIPTYDPDWFARLPVDHQGSVRARFAEERRRNEAVTEVHCTTFAQRLTLAHKVGIRDVLDGSQTTWGRLVPLRNALAHGRPLGRGSRLNLLDLAVRARDLARQAWGLVQDDPRIWRAYASSDLVTGPADLALTGPTANGWPWRGVVYAISAQNPYDHRLSDTENRARHERLIVRLKADSLGEGRAGAGGWFEDVVYAAMPQESALEVARQFGQRALFELDDAEVRIIEAHTGEVRARFPRRSPTADRFTSSGVKKP